MTLRETLDQAYDAMSLEWGVMRKRLIDTANEWAVKHNLDLDAHNEVLRYLKEREY